MDSSSNSTRERILDAAELLLHRIGPAKTGVVDVARSLGMSHANVYRHFASKADLRDAVVDRWLRKISEPLEEIAASDLAPPERLEAWLWSLIEGKRRKLLDDPEMFATYHLLAEEARGAVDHHVRSMLNQLTRIIEDGRDAAVFRTDDPAASAKAVLHATAKFHHPHFVRDPATRGTDEEARTMIKLLLAGLRAG